MCPTKAAAAASQDFRNQGHAEIMNVVSDDERQLGTGGDEALDESTTDWDKNGWTAELYQHLGTDISDVQELPIDSQPITFDAQEDVNMICNNQVANVLVEEEAIAVVNQPVDGSGADQLDEKGWNPVSYKKCGRADEGNRREILDHTTSGVVQEFPEVPVILDDPLQGRDILDFLLEETVGLVEELPAAVWVKNGKRDEWYKGLDGADNNDIIILDECSTVVHDVKELMMIGTADPPPIKATNVDDHADNDMEGNKQIVDDFWNFEPVGTSPAVSPLNTTWDGLDVILDFSSPELCDLWGNETNEQSCNIFEGQHEKRMGYGEEDCEECPTGKKQRCLWQ